MSGVELELNKVTAPIQLQTTKINNKTDEQKTQIAASNAIEQKPDSFEKTQEIPQTNIKEEETKNKANNNQPKSFKEKFASFCKTFVKTGDYIKATGATVIYGGLTAGAIMFSNWLFKGWPKVMKKQIKFEDMFNKPLKCISKSSKIFAGVTAAAIGGYQFAKAYLKSNQHAAHVDQKLNNYSKVKS